MDLRRTPARLASDTQKNRDFNQMRLALRDRTSGVGVSVINDL
jgi:hypothetical protein